MDIRRKYFKLREKSTSVNRIKQMGKGSLQFDRLKVHCQNGVVADYSKLLQLRMFLYKYINNNFTEFHIIYLWSSIQMKMKTKAGKNTDLLYLFC